MMSNKQTGTAFERRVCEVLKSKGYWVHFLAPDSRGSQPFDIIAVKNGMAAAIECKTLNDDDKVFPISRLEDNQKYAFEYWCKCGNADPLIAVKWRGEIKWIKWSELRQKRKIRFE